MKRPGSARRPAAVFKPNARTATIKTIIEQAIAREGFAPSDTQIARLLAMDVGRVRKHRAALGM